MLKWTSGITVVVLIAVWAASYFYYMNVTIAGRWGCDLEGGEVRAGDFLRWYGTAPSSKYVAAIESSRFLSVRGHPIENTENIQWFFGFQWQDVIVAFPIWALTEFIAIVFACSLVYERIRNTLKWSITVLTAVVVIAWLASGWFSVVYQEFAGRYSLEFGQVSFDDQFVEEMVSWTEHGSDYNGWHVSKPSGGMPKFSWRYYAGTSNLSIPLWPVVLVMCGMSGLWWRSDAIARRRTRRGRCATCGYDRSGLAQDVKCPECGKITRV